MGDDSTGSTPGDSEGGGQSQDPDPGDSDGDPTIVTELIDPNATTAEYDFLEIVAELEGRQIDELPSLYTQVDHFVETLFKRPPAHEAQMQIEFSYAGYRVTIDQRGQVTLVPVKDSVDD